MSKKRVDHTVFRNGNFFCTHCGGKKKLALPQAIDTFARDTKAFTKAHKDCKPVWKQPIPDAGMTIMQRERFWLEHGEHGSSSKAMFKRLACYPNNVEAGVDHPYDPSDFRRCHALLEMIPEWRGELERMAELSPVWRKLVENWEKLTDMLIEMMETKKDNGMYALMRECRGE